MSRRQRPRKTRKDFRLSDHAIAALYDLARRHHMTMTRTVEVALALMWKDVPGPSRKSALGKSVHTMGQSLQPQGMQGTGPPTARSQSQDATAGPSRDATAGPSRGQPGR